MSEGQEVHPAFYSLFAVPGILVGLVLGFQQWRCHADVPMVLERFRESLKKVEGTIRRIAVEVKTESAKREQKHQLSARLEFLASQRLKNSRMESLLNIVRDRIAEFNTNKEPKAGVFLFQHAAHDVAELEHEIRLKFDEIGQLTEEAMRVERRLKTGEVVAKNYENYLYVNEAVSEVDAENLRQLEAELDEVTAEFSGLLARPTKMKESFILEGNGDSPAATSDQSDKNSAARRSYVATIRSHLKVVSTAGC
ncbi:unnamed protein product [Notodromas monacha]|uniref:Uncharacterized protein n=1 Tax=Notodromas monacha TaxID=399045 RepID=A0A7R9GAE0_9CRUS|nr:unnamed protein product [Notodromas monacha]CAG0913894.1 unnamed protein product [Notodromas monacha]